MTPFPALFAAVDLATTALRSALADVERAAGEDPRYAGVGLEASRMRQKAEGIGMIGARTLLAEIEQSKGPMVTLTDHEGQPLVGDELVRCTATQVVLRDVGGRKRSYHLKNGRRVDASHNFRGDRRPYIGAAELERVRAIEWKAPRAPKAGAK